MFFESVCVKFGYCTISWNIVCCFPNNQNHYNMPTFIKIDLSSLTIDGLNTTTGTISTNMKGNPDFPSPPVSFDDLDRLRGDLAKYLIDKDLLSKMDRKNRDELVALIVAGYKRNGQYVIMLFPDDESKQLSSGFPSVRSRTKMTTPPDKPTNLRVRNSKQSGEAIVNCKKHHGTVSLNIKVVNKETKEEFVVTSTSSVGIKISNLVPGKFYDFFAQAVGTAGTSDYTDAVGITVT